MKGERGVQAVGQFSGARLPTDTPWFIRLGRLTDDTPTLASPEWALLCRSAVPTPQATSGSGIFSPLGSASASIPRALPPPASLALPVNPNPKP